MNQTPRRQRSAALCLAILFGTGIPTALSALAKPVHPPHPPAGIERSTDRDIDPRRTC
jgi:hypothetical protein